MAEGFHSTLRSLCCGAVAAHVPRHKTAESRLVILSCNDDIDFRYAPRDGSSTQWDAAEGACVIEPHMRTHTVGTSDEQNLALLQFVLRVPQSICISTPNKT